MDNIIHVNFGEARNREQLVDSTKAKLRAPPWNLSESNASLLSESLAECVQAFGQIKEADISWKQDDPPEVVGRQLNAFALKCRNVAYDQITKAFFVALAYGTNERPRG